MMEQAHVNFLGGSPLNRLSWLRSSTTFLATVLQSPATRWLIFQDGQPLISTGRASMANTTATQPPSASVHSLARLTTADIKSFLGPEPYFGQGKEIGDVAPQDNSVLEAARHHGPNIVFIGLEEPQSDSNTNGGTALPSSDFSAKSGDAQAVAVKIEGTPFFSLDVSDLAKDEVDQVLREVEKKKENAGIKLEFVEPRSSMTGLSMFDAAVFASARSMVDWNARNQFCPGCGSPTYSTWAGWKLTCSSLLPWADNVGRKPCPSAKGVHNFSHPRTDAVVIMAILDESGDKILLGRNRRFPAGFYSTLAGFVEPGESFEDAVKREIWEEAGVKVWDVKYHSGQPWPFPANLMVGFYAYADASQPIRLDLDNELVDAGWFTRGQILAVLAQPQRNVLTQREYKKFDEEESKGKAAAAKEEDKAPSSLTANAALAPADPSVQMKQGQADKETVSASTVASRSSASAETQFRVPPLTAIAGVLISDWAHGRLHRKGSVKGSL